jgi:hypothetical protein
MGKILRLMLMVRKRYGDENHLTSMLVMALVTGQRSVSNVFGRIYLGLFVKDVE